MNNVHKNETCLFIDVQGRHLWIRVHLPVHSWNSKASLCCFVLWIEEPDCPWVSSPSMQMEAPWTRGLPTTWVNVTPHSWAWPVAPTMISRQQWWGKEHRFYAHERKNTRIVALSALHCYHICHGHVYLYLPSCYFKVSSVMAPIAPIHEKINNWSPPVEYVALHVVSWRSLVFWDM